MKTVLFYGKFLKRLLLFFTKQRFWSDSIVFNTRLLWTSHSPSFVLKPLQWISQELKITFPSVGILSAAIRGPNMAVPLHSSQWDVWDICFAFCPLYITWQAVHGPQNADPGGKVSWPPFFPSSGTGHPPGLERLPTPGTSPGGSVVPARKVPIKDQQAFAWIFKCPFGPLGSESGPGSGKRRNKHLLLQHSKQCENFKLISK